MRFSIRLQFEQLFSVHQRQRHSAVVFTNSSVQWPTSVLHAQRYAFDQSITTEQGFSNDCFNSILVSVPTPSCVSSTSISPVSCSQTVPSNDLQFLFTPCTVGTVTGVSPIRGPSGTSITISGTGFNATTCENDVFIGPVYRCPITNATSTQIICQIGPNSLLSASTVQNVQVNRVRRGALSNDGLFQFQFQAEITSVAPLRGTFVLSSVGADVDVSFRPSRLHCRRYGSCDQR